MQRPDDRRSKIGAANDSSSARNNNSRTRPRERDGRSRDETRKGENGPRRFPGAEKASRGASPPRRDRPRDRSRNRRDSPERGAPRLKVIYNIIDKCTVNDYALRDGSFHEGENFYDFLKKLLDQVNQTLMTTVAPEAYKLKELRETISPASMGEKRKFSQLVKMPDHMLHCASVIVGLPPCVFFGNGFSERQWSLAKASAGKDVIEKIYRIGFISPRLYESVARSSLIDEKTRLPDFTKCVRAFVSLEKHMVKHSWPWDVLTAPEQPLAVLDRLKSIFREVLSEVYGITEPPVVDGGPKKDPRTREEIEIERKIVLQREELLRRERAREMVEPLDDAPIGGVPPLIAAKAAAAAAAAAATAPHPWNGPRIPPMMMGGPMMGMPMMGGHPTGIMGAPQVPFMPPPQLQQPPLLNQRPVDMDIDESPPEPHPYRRRESPPPRERYGRERSPDRYRRDDDMRRRDDDMRRRDEDERLRRKEEELEKKMNEEEERRKLTIEAEVRRRLQEEMAKLNPPQQDPIPTNPGFANGGYQNQQPFPGSSNGGYGAGVGVNYGNPTVGAVGSYDAEMEEIHRLMKETEDRLKDLQEQESSMYAGDNNTLRTLASLGESASGMTSYQKKDLITELKNLLGHSNGPPAYGGAVGGGVAPPTLAPRVDAKDHWRETTSRDIPVARPPQCEDRYISTYHDRPRERYERRRSRSRSPVRRERERSPPGRSRPRDSQYDRERRDQKSREDPPCPFCDSPAHLPDMCHVYTSPALRKTELKKKFRCPVCLKRHGGRCEAGQPCEYCNHKTHHRTVCEHPDHIKKLSALRDLARGY